MTENIENKEPVAAAAADSSKREPRGRNDRRQGGRPDSRRAPKEKSDNLEEKSLQLNATSKTVAGGRRRSFSALVIVGDKNGRIGIGFAKAKEVADAMRKGGESARRNIITFERDGRTIPHEIEHTVDGARVLLRPAKPGTGIVAGSVVKDVLEFAGIKDCVAKNLGGSNKINMVRATIGALLNLRNRKEALALRGIELRGQE